MEEGGSIYPWCAYVVQMQMQLDGNANDSYGLNTEPQLTEDKLGLLLTSPT